jgi:hypothetical protein
MARPEQADSTDTHEATEPIDPIDRADPMLPTDSTDPTDPMDSTEPRLATDKMESVDHSDQRDLAPRCFTPAPDVATAGGPEVEAAVRPRPSTAPRTSRLPRWRSGNTRARIELIDLSCQNGSDR